MFNATLPKWCRLCGRAMRLRKQGRYVCQCCEKKEQAEQPSRYDPLPPGSLDHPWRP